MVETEAFWRDWLATNHASHGSIWVVTWKKASFGPHVPYATLVEQALCFGWIDSRPARLDDQRTMLLFSPRRKGSRWSKLNRDRVARLSAAGLIAPAGEAVITGAQQDGSWQALDAVDALVEPADLASRLDAMPQARAAWDGFPPSVRRGLLERILSAKRDQTRAATIERIVADAARGVRTGFKAAARPGDA